MSEFKQIFEQIGTGVPDAALYLKMSTLFIEVPEAASLKAMDPFDPAYRIAVVALYLSIRGRPEEGYKPTRDEISTFGQPKNLWTDTIPWSFRDASTLSEHCAAWGSVFAHAELPEGGRILEYGPGSGQILIMAARMGYHAYGVDIDHGALECIRNQADSLGLTVMTEQAEFGDGFDEQTFHTILFYEAFHHALEFEDLLVRLQSRVCPGGRVLLCGEPIVEETFNGIPYPWGPRLDALSVFCMRRFGWMELGFTHAYFVEVAKRCGWIAVHFPDNRTGRASLYVLQRVGEYSEKPKRLSGEVEMLNARIAQLEHALRSIKSSSCWRLTAPIRFFINGIYRTLTRSSSANRG